MTARSVEQEILDLEHEWMGTGLSRDRARCEVLTAEEFVLVSAWWGVGGATVLGRRAWLERSFAFHDPRVEVAGDTALVTTDWTQDATVDGQDWNIGARLTDVWARRDGRWQVVSRYSRPRT